MPLLINSSGANNAFISVFGIFRVIIIGVWHKIIYFSNSSHHNGVQMQSVRPQLQEAAFSMQEWSLSPIDAKVSTVQDWRAEELLGPDLCPVFVYIIKWWYGGLQQPAICFIEYHQKKRNKATIY